MKVLITGGAGMIGSVLVEQLLQNGEEVYVLDNLMYRQTSLMSFCHNPKFHFHYGDVRDEVKLLELLNKVDVILPLACIVGAPACDKDKNLATEVNFQHVKFLAQRKSKDQKLCFPNSNSGYGVGEKDTFCTEESPLRPISHYGKTKCEAENWVLENGGISLRLATVFGLSYRTRLDLLVNDFTYRALTDGFLALFEQHFKRNYIHVRDVATAFMQMIQQYDKCFGNAYNVGLSSANLSKRELAEKIKEHVPKLVIFADDFHQDVDKRNYIVSNDKLEATGWNPAYSLDDGIKELINGYKMLFQNQQAFTNL